MTAATSTEHEVEAAFAAPSTDHIIATNDILRSARADWHKLRDVRLELASAIADRAAYAGDTDSAELDAYRKIHAQQADAKQRVVLAMTEVVRAIESVTE